MKLLETSRYAHVSISMKLLQLSITIGLSKQFVNYKVESLQNLPLNCFPSF